LKAVRKVDVSLSWETTHLLLNKLQRDIETAFAPDVVVTMSGPGSFAACYCMGLNPRDVAVIFATTFPKRNERNASHQIFRRAAMASGWIYIDTNKWEVLPSVTRTLDFRLTVRDNHPGGGRTKSDDMIVHTVAGAGPFAITFPQGNVLWKAGSKHTITWNVANTNVAPVNCTNVKILLSTDGGQTFNTVLKNGAINDGSVQVTIPQGISTSNARIKIMAVGNIFFDICDYDFRITASGFADITENASAATIATAVKVQPNPAKEYTNVIFNTVSYNCSISLSNNEGKTIYTKTFNNVYKGMVEKISLTGLSRGNYFIKIVTDNGTQTEKIIVQ